MDWSKLAEARRGSAQKQTKGTKGLLGHLARDEGNRAVQDETSPVQAKSSQIKLT
jgi:hypothetical protein